MASIKCGNCSETHTSVAEVRDCYKVIRVDKQTGEVTIAPEATVPNRNHSLTDEQMQGMWKLGERIFKVQIAVHGSGRAYAKELIVATSGDPGDPDVSAGFDYAPGAISQLRNSARAHKLTLEEAKEFGALYGVCCVCGRTLTNETSIEAGIGPICSGRLA